MSAAGWKVLFWLAATCVFIGFLYLVREILLPFVLGLAIAYAFDPLADALERRKVPRAIASALILVGVFAAAVAALVLLVPLLQEQLVLLAHQIPDLVAWVQAQTADLVEALRGRIAAQDVAQLQEAARGYAGDVLSWLGKLVSKLWSGGLAVVNLISLVIVTPVVAFYLLRDWDALLARVDSWLPRGAAPTIRAQAREIDRLISEYVRGVASVCLILAVFYGGLLTLVGLDYGLVVGVFAGLISFIPFIGAILGFVISVALALYQFSDWIQVGLVAGIFVAGQLLESNIITPRLVGERIGLHPVWVLFALFAGGILFGFVGVLLAVPAAAAIGVLTRFALDRYLESPIYLGAKKHGSRRKR